MADLYDQNIAAFKALNSDDSDILRWFTGYCTKEDVKYLSEYGIDIAKFIRDKKKQLNSIGFSEDERDSGIPEQIFEEISYAIRSKIPDFNDAASENEDSENLIISVACKLDKPHRFKLLGNKSFSTKMVYLQDEEIFLGKYNLWEDLLSGNSLKLKDIQWLLNALPTLKCGKIKREYVAF